ncbi:hypothetical protein AYX19_21345 (plasmid) [Paenarthrobacter ureafaciens]|nr:hypothetical protein AYX19_21345 [Paenarthrobacter ureafaciens]
MLNMGELFRYPRVPAIEMARVEISEYDSERTLLRRHDLLFARRSLTLEGAGKCSIVDEVDEPTTWEGSILRARLDPAIAHAPYYYYYFASPQGRRNIETIVEQVAAAGIRGSDLKKLKVPLPGLPEQHAVADVLGALDDKIAANTSLIEVADDLAASLTRQALDVSSRVALSTIADIVMGSSPSGTSFNEKGEGTVFYQGIRDFGVRFPSNRIWTTAPVRLAAAGDTLLSVRAPVGRVNLATEKTCIGRGLASIRSSDERPFTLFHLLKDSDEAWAPFEAEGTVFGSINKGQLASLRVPGLRPEFEGTLEDALRPIEQTIASVLGENDNLSATRDALLPQLMSGKLRVKDAEKVLEAAGV